jgi:hypothetical protein
MATIRFWLSVTATLGAAFVLFPAACGSPERGSGFAPGPTSSGGSSGGSSSGGSSGASTGSSGGGSSGSSSGSLFGDGGFPSSSSGGDGGVTCTTGLCTQIHKCMTGSTTISGTIYDPAGKNPLYDVVAYVPNQTPKAITPGAACYQCGDLYTGEPIATALSDTAGKFTIANAPDGANIPLVIQIGKWRRQLTVPNVARCMDTAVPDKTLTLPKNQSEGDIPSIGIATGWSDSMECLLQRIGVDPGEYGGGGTGTGRIHIFQGVNTNTTKTGATTSPAAPIASASMWDMKADLMPYDIVILSCEGNETTEMNQQALFDYAAAGGRVFASHFHYSWFTPMGPFSTYNLATWTAGANAMTKGNAIVGGVIQTTLANGMPFPKGQALQQWLTNVNALGVNGAPAGELPIQQPKHNADVSAANTPSTAWIVADQQAMPPGATQYFSFDTPLGSPAAMQCGRVVYSDLHVGSATMDYGGAPGNLPITQTCPAGCVMADLSPQEKALEFMLFDLSACLTPPSQPPMPPPPQ